MTDDEPIRLGTGYQFVFSLQRSQYQMMRQLADELGMTETVLAEHAITSLWVWTQIQRAAARMK